MPWSWGRRPSPPLAFTLAAARLAPPDPGRTTRLDAAALPGPPVVGPLAPPADPALPVVLPRLHLYHALVIRPATGARTSWGGGGYPAGWEFVRLEDYPVAAAHIRVAALKATVEHDLLAALAPADTCLAVRWLGYAEPTLYVNYAWLAARLAALDRYVTARQGGAP